MARFLAAPLAVVLLCIGILCLAQVRDFGHFKAHAQLTATGVGAGGFGAASGGCSQATALLAEMDGSQNTSAVTTAVCTMVTNGDYAHLDFLYMGVINSVANSLLNWAQNAYNLVSHGTITFNANQGWTSDGSSGYYNTQFAPSTAGGHMALNNGSLTSCQFGTNSSGTFYSIGSQGTNGGTTYSGIAWSGSATYGLINDQAFANTSATNLKGAWTITRAAAPDLTFYLSGSSVPHSPTSAAALGMPEQPFALLALNQAGTIADYDPGQIGYAWGGDASVSPSNMYNVLHAYIAAVSGPSGC